MEVPTLGLWKDRYQEHRYCAEHDNVSTDLQAGAFFNGLVLIFIRWLIVIFFVLCVRFSHGLVVIQGIQIFHTAAFGELVSLLGVVTATAV